MFLITKLFLGSFLGFFIIPTTIDFERRKDFSEKSLAGLYQYKNKKALARSFVYLFKIHCQYWAIPCLVLHFLYKYFNHRLRWEGPVGDYLDVGYIASYAVRNHRNLLLKFYLMLGFNPSFRDAGCTTLFEYAFLYDNQEAGKLLAEHKDVVDCACHSYEWLSSKAKENILLLSGIGSPIFLVAQFFLKKFIIVKMISCDGSKCNPAMFHKSGSLISNEVSKFDFNCLHSKVFEDPFSIEYNKIEYILSLKFFEKICLAEDFSQADIQFLQEQEIRFSPNGYPQDYVKILNQGKSNLALKN